MKEFFKEFLDALKVLALLSLTLLCVFIGALVYIDFDEYLEKIAVDERIYTGPANKPENEQPYKIPVVVVGLEQIMGNTTALLSLKSSAVNLTENDLTIISNALELNGGNNNIPSFWTIKMDVDTSKPIPTIGTTANLEVSENGCAFLTFTEYSKGGSVEHVNTVCNLQCGCGDYVIETTRPENNTVFDPVGSIFMWLLSEPITFAK